MLCLLLGALHLVECYLADHVLEGNARSETQIDGGDVCCGEDGFLTGYLIHHAFAYAIALKYDVEGAKLSEVDDVPVEDELTDTLHGIGKDTLDEAPFAYRGLEEIAEAIKGTVTIDKIIRPVYNFKAGGED